jgi:hypothetical protein
VAVSFVGTGAWRGFGPKSFAITAIKNGSALRISQSPRFADAA